MKKPKREMSEAHRQKLRDAYNKRRQAKEAGIHLPTIKEKREAARLAKKGPATTQDVKNLIADSTVTEEENRINVPAFYHTESVPSKRHPLRFREINDKINSLK